MELLYLLPEWGGRERKVYPKIGSRVLGNAVIYVPTTWCKTTEY